MRRHEFVQRYSLNTALKAEDPFAHDVANHPKLRQAAVLIALQEIDGRLYLLLTQRSKHLSSHPGQISFPGGRIDKDDLSPWHAALREAYEEIGLPPTSVKQIGHLPSFHTISRYQIQPFVGLIEKDFQPKLSINEVERFFRVPLKEFLDPKGRIAINVERGAFRHSVYFMPKGVWGATAAIIEHLARHLGYPKALSAS